MHRPAKCVRRGLTALACSAIPRRCCGATGGSLMEPLPQDDSGATHELSGAMDSQEESKCLAVESEAASSVSVPGGGALPAAAPAHDTQAGEPHVMEGDDAGGQPTDASRTVDGGFHRAWDTDSDSGSSEGTPGEADIFCRVCRGGARASAPLHRPCLCSGSIQYCHEG